VLLLLPTAIWWRIFRIRTLEAKHPDWSRWTTAALFALGVLYFLAPHYAYGENGFGTHVVSAHAAGVALIAGATLFVICAAFGSVSRTRRLLMLGPMLLSLLFLGIYAYSAFSSSFLAYAHEIMALTLRTSLVTPLLVSLCCVSLFFCITGFCSLLYEMWRD
jgi:hypothetical protein